MDPTFLLSVFIFLIAASVLVPISKLTGFGSVIGYLIAGILIGPSVTGLITEPETILHFSEFGVVMMLFLIGLELQPAALWAMRTKLLGLGGLQVGLTILLLAMAMLTLGYAWPVALVVGMALALSSTAVGLQIMQDRKMLKTTVGQSGFSILLFQDVIVIVMIAVIPLIATYAGDLAPDVISDTAHYDDSHGGGHGNDDHGAGFHGPTGLWRGLAIIGVFAGMIIGGRLVLRPVFRLIARSRVRETFTAISLALVVGAALLMGWLGLSAALGAFIAGVVLADSEYRHQLERDIEPFKALLLGLFFMSVGMSLDFAVISQNPGLIFGGTLGLVLIKFIVLFGIGWIFKLVLSSRILLACLLCQAGEFGFVLFQFARTEGLMSPALISQCSAIIALSMALTLLILIVYDRLIAPRFSEPVTTGETPTNQHHKVLILGFGRVGQVCSRLIHTQDVETTLLDHDGDHIELVRQFGNRVFYGDAGDVDLLHLAGAEDADVIVIAIDDPEKSTLIAHEVKDHFPQAKIIARARNRTHMFDLMAAKVDFVERETVRGALAMGREALMALGYSHKRAQQLSDDFLTYDYQLIQDTWQHRGDLETLIEKAESGREFIKRTLNADLDRAGHNKQADRDNAVSVEDEAG